MPLYCPIVTVQINTSDEDFQIRVVCAAGGFGWEKGGLNKQGLEAVMAYAYRKGIVGKRSVWVGREGHGRFRTSKQLRASLKYNLERVMHHMRLCA